VDKKARLPQVSLFGLSLDQFSAQYQIVILTVVVFITEISYGFAQQLLYSVHKFPYEWFSTLMQFIFYGVLSFFQYLSTKKTTIKRKRNPKTIRNKKLLIFGHLAIAIVSLLSRGLGNAAFKHLDYGLKVLFTSAKPVLVMIAGISFLHKKYSLMEYLSTVMLVIGLAGFSVADAQGTGLFSMLGIVLIFGSLLTDSLKSAFQEWVMTDFDQSEVDVSLWSSILGAFMTLVVVVYTDQLWPGLHYCMENPKTWLLMAIFFTFGYISSIAGLSLIVVSDAFTYSIITTARKAVTVFLSFITFQKSISLQHALSMLTFFGAVFAV